MRDVTAKFKSEMNTLRCRLEEETSKSHAQLSEQETTFAEEIFQIKQVHLKPVFTIPNLICFALGIHKTSSSFGRHSKEVQTACR